MQPASTPPTRAVTYEAESSAQAARRSSDFRSSIRPKVDLGTRFRNVWHHLTERPSLLSNTSDSANTGHNEEFEQYHLSTDRDPRLYRLDRKRSRGRHRRRPESASQSRTVDDDIGDREDGLDGDPEKSEEEEKVTSKVVVDNDFSTWIDPRTGRISSTHQEAEDDNGSMQTGHSVTDHTETTHHGSARVQKAADDLHMPWMGHFMENVRYFFDMSFPERSKEKSYLKDVSRASRPRSGIR